MSDKSVKLNTIIWRIGALILAIFCLISTYFAAKWFFANTIALRAAYKEIAEAAVNLAPNDPQTHFSYAVLLEKTFYPEDLPKSVAEYEKAAALSPNDFNLWLELGKARERSGDLQGAELALRKSLALAPHYSRVQWTLGNFLLRQGKTEEAYAEIRKAAAGDSQYASPAVSGAWQIFAGDIGQMKQFVGDSANLKSAFAALFAREKRFNEALEIWSSLPEAERKTVFKQNGEEIYQKMLEAKKYRDALQLFGQISETEKKFAVGKIENGGFELENPKNPSVFEWQIADGIEPQIGVDNANKHEGNLSLVMLFNSTNGKAFRTISQTVAVEADKKYVFEAFYKADLKTSGTLKWEIVNAADGKVLASTEAIAAKSDWTNLKAEWTTAADAEAVIIRLVKADCGAAICPISGKVWFDSFSLKNQ